MALLAVLKAGAACVPLDPAYPKERLTYMLEDSATALVLTQAGLLAEVTDFDAEVVNLDADWKLFAAESGENVRSGVKPENLAYVIYTSGSTGKPRGVLLTHGGLVNHNVAAAQLVRNHAGGPNGAVCVDLIRHCGGRNLSRPGWRGSAGRARGRRVAGGGRLSALGARRSA